MAEAGTHSELLSKNGRYLDLWTLQRSRRGLAGDAARAGYSSGSSTCSPNPKSRSSTDAILPSFVKKTYSLAVLGIQSSSSSMNESVLYQTSFPDDRP